jgi:hypothetical protein
MKKRQKFFAVAFSVVLVCAIVISNVYESNGQSTYVNTGTLDSYGTGPGGPNNRRNQAVNCPKPGFPWRVIPGCCWGYSACDFSICDGQSGC